MWSWFNSNRHWLEVDQLPPPCSPEFNPTERLWQPTQKNGTHHCFISGVDALFATLGPKVQAKQRTIIDLNSKDSGAEERPEGDTWRV